MKYKKYKLKYISKIIAGGTPSTDNDAYWKGDIPWLDSGKVNYERILPDYVEKFITDEALKKTSTKLVKKNSPLLAITGATCSNVGYLTFNSSINQSILGFENYENFDSKYIFYLLKSLKDEILSLRSGGAQGGVTKSDIENLNFESPDLANQKIIVDNLEKQLDVLDKIIKQTNKKIQLFLEQRVSSINELIFKGSKIKTKFKDTKISYIGKVPDHWSVHRLKYILNVRKERSKNGKEELLSVTIKNGVVKRSDYLGEDDTNLSRAESLVGYKNVFKNDLVNNIMKMSFYCLGVSEYDGIVSPAYSVFKINQKKVYPGYLHNLLRTPQYIGEYLKRSKGIQVTKMRLYDDYFLDISIPVPPYEEQIKISDLIKTDELDQIIDKENKILNFLNEYRNSIICFALKNINFNE